MKKKVFFSIEEIKNVWEKLYSNNENFSWYQTYNWNKVLEESFIQNHHRSKTLNYLVFDDKFIAPMVIEKKEKKISFLGADESSDYLSFIFSRDETESQIIEYLNALFDHYLGYKIQLDRINERNVLHNILNKNFTNLFHAEEKYCVFINTVTDTSSYLESLSKSSRQNYRTAINRLKSDSLDYEINVKYDILTQDETECLLDLYKARRTDCSNNSKSRNLLTKVIKYIARKKECDILSEYSRRENVFLATINISGQLAAFCEGNYNNKKETLSISRIATNPAYYKYSPGNILLINVVEKIRSTVRYLDLTRGLEEYKVKLGGEIHHNYLYKSMYL